MQKKNNPTVCLTGSFSVGKSTQIAHLKKTFADKDIHYVEDAGRKLIREMGIKIEDATEQQREDLQMQAVEHYLRGESEGRFQGKDVIMDASLVEAIAYAKDVTSQRVYETLNNILSYKAKSYLALYISPKVGLVNDGERHVSEEYRRYIDRVIVELLQEHKVRTIHIASTHPELRKSHVALSVAQAFNY